MIYVPNCFRVLQRWLVFPRLASGALFFPRFARFTCFARLVSCSWAVGRPQSATSNQLHVFPRFATSFIFLARPARCPGNVFSYCTWHWSEVARLVMVAHFPAFLQCSEFWLVCLTFCEDKEKLKNDVILETESTAKVVLVVIHCVLLLSYKESFTRLRSLKTEIEHLQHLLEKAKVKMQKDFEIWWAEQASFNQVYTENIRSVSCVFSSTSTGTISRHNLTPWGLEELVTTGAQRSVCVYVWLCVG